MSAMQAVRKAPVLVGLDVERIRADFPILKLQVNGKPLVYLDNAASSQMPQQVIDRLVRYQTTQHANINRAVHSLSEIATDAYEQARRKLQHFIHAREDREVIFTSGTTDGTTDGSDDAETSPGNCPKDDALAPCGKVWD